MGRGWIEAGAGVAIYFLYDSLRDATMGATATALANGKQIVDRVGEKPQNERVVSREERPVKIKELFLSRQPPHRF